MVSALKLQLWYLPMMNGSNTMINCTARKKTVMLFSDVFREFFMLYTP